MKKLIGLLKRLPWRSLIQATLLTLLVVTLVDVAIAVLIAQSPDMGKLLELLFNPPLGILIFFATAVGIGALSVAMLERIDRFSITTNSLWGLAFCLILACLLKLQLPLPSPLTPSGQGEFVAMIVGIFWKGRPYWRSFRRW